MTKQAIGEAIVAVENTVKEARAAKAAPAKKAPAKKAPAKKAPAKKATAADLAKPGTVQVKAGADKPGDVRHVAFGKLTPCPLNPRKAVGDVEELAASIDEFGVLQNLLARPKAEGDLEIVIGERRWTAFKALVAAGKRTVEDELPVRVAEISDDEVIAIGLVENGERADLNPMDEAEAFKRLIGLGWSTEKIAERLPYGRRFVQKRVTLVEKLAKPAKDAIRAGDVSTEQALVMAAFCDKDRQAAVVKHIKAGHYAYVRTDMLKRTLVADTIDANKAAFAIADYEAAGGHVVEDGEERFLKDVELFHKMQREARAARKKALIAEGWQWVESLDGWEPANWYKYKKSKNKKVAGCVLQITPTGCLVEHVGLIKPADVKAAEKAEKADARENDGLDGEPFTKAAKNEARRIKTRALRAAMIKSGSPRFAMMATIVAVSTETGSILFGKTHYPEGYRVEAPIVDAEIKKHGPGYKVGAHASDIWARLMKLTDEQVEGLFVAVVANQIGTFPGYDEELGDHELPLAMANDMKAADHVDATLDEAFLKACRKPALVALCDALQVTHPTKDPEGLLTLDKATLVKMPAGKLRAALLRQDPAVEGHRFDKVGRPAILWFATKAAIEKQWAATVATLREGLAKAKGSSS